MNILSIGECMAELAPADKAGEFTLGFAGDTFNTAWYIAQINPSIEVGYFTTIGDDPVSQQMADAIVASGVNTRFVSSVEGETVGLYLISLDNGERSFSYWRGQSAARKLADDGKQLAEAIAQAQLIYFSGITLAILRPPARKTLLNILREARSAGKMVAFDPNLRPRLWQNSTEMTQTIMQGAAVCTIALPSFEDEASWFSDASPQATAQRYKDAGAKTIIVKNGNAPVFYCEGNESGEIDVTPVANVVDTTAAGDSFNAAFLSSVYAKRSVQEAIENACALASRVVQAKGALVPIDAD